MARKLTQSRGALKLHTVGRRVMVVLVLLLAHRPALAQQVTPEEVAAEAEAEKSKLPPDTFSGEAMVGKIGEDVYINFAARLSFDRENFGIGLGLPLRFRLIDNDPESSASAFGLRSRDWDEFTDFLRIIRYVYVGKADKTGPYYVRLGELEALTMGHGTIVHRYRNTLDLDHWRVGTDIAVNAGAFGVEAMIADLGRIEDPFVAGFRVSARPFEVAWGEGLWDRFVVGWSLFSDPTAPLSLSTVDDPSGSGRQLLRTDGSNRPIVTRERALIMTGIDLGYEVMRGEPLAITPYLDINKITEVDTGVGLHLGVLWAVRLPAGVDTFMADLRTEYRRVSGDYLGPYFTTAYDIERYVYTPGADVPVTKLQALSFGGPGKNGLWFDFLAGLPSFVLVGGEYLDYDGGLADGQARLSLHVPVLEFVKFHAFYYRVNIAGLDDLFELDDRSAVVAEVEVPVYQFLSLKGRWWRLWRATPAGAFEAVDDWSVGVGFNFEL